MLTQVAAHIKRHPVLSFIVLAYGITRLAVIPFALGVWPAPMFPFGPLVAALIVAPICGGWTELRSLLLRMVQWRVAPRWYAFALDPLGGRALLTPAAARALSPARPPARGSLRPAC